MLVSPFVNDEHAMKQQQGRSPVVAGASPSNPTQAFTVGMLINNGGRFVNGSETQPFFLCESLKAMGCNVRLFTHRGGYLKVGESEKSVSSGTSTSTPNETSPPASAGGGGEMVAVCGVARGTDFYGYQLEEIEKTSTLDGIDLFIMICHIIKDGTPLSDHVHGLLKGRRAVSFLQANHVLFNAEDVVFGKHGVVRLLFNSWATETWVYPMQAQHVEYFELLNHKPARVMPYVWSPSLLTKYTNEKQMNIFCDASRYTSGAKLALCCFTPNLNVSKTCLVPLLIMNKFYRLHPDRVEKCFVFCAQHLLDNQPFKDFLAFLDITKDRMLEVYPRMAFPEVLKQLAEKSMRPVVIDNQWENPQNYLSLEVLYLGYPLVHNSLPIKGAGFFYDMWNLHGAVEQLRAISRGDFARDAASYRIAADAVLWENSTVNPVNVEWFRRIIMTPAVSVMPRTEFAS